LALDLWAAQHELQLVIKQFGRGEKRAAIYRPLLL